jgi:hypothetical protein
MTPRDVERTARRIVRGLAPMETLPRIGGPDDAAAIVTPLIRSTERESLAAIAIGAGGRVVGA